MNGAADISRGCIVPTFRYRFSGKASGEVAVKIDSSGGTATRSERTDGFAMADSLTALFLIAIALAVSLSAQSSAQQLLISAKERREAAALLQATLVNPMQVASEEIYGDTHLQITEAPSDGQRPIELCFRQAELTNAASSRTYKAATTVTCPNVAT